MSVALAYLEICAPPTLLAAAPGIAALLMHRRRLGSLQIVLAVLSTFLPFYLGQQEAGRLAQHGIISCSAYELFEPWIHAISYGVLSGGALVFAIAFLPDPTKRR